jgi:hypothetical protein
MLKNIKLFGKLAYHYWFLERKKSKIINSNITQIDGRIKCFDLTYRLENRIR